MKTHNQIPHTDLKLYFEDTIRSVSAIQPKEDRLQPKELRFLVACCMLNAFGYNLNSYKELCKGMREHFQEFGNEGTVSQYKTRVAQKKFIRSGRDSLVLPKYLDATKWSSLGNQTFIVELSINGEFVKRSLTSSKYVSN